jgi:adenylyltransferase/sulfurtransferase
MTTTTGRGARPTPYVSTSSPQAIAETAVTSPVRELPPLTHEEILRYSRHLILPDVGVEGQRKLKAARVLLIGAGGLGSPLALYLSAAGVGHLGIVDFDVVDVTNLQRQVLHGTSDVGKPKLDSARRRIAEVNPHVEVTTYEEPLTSANALDIIRDYDIVVDGTDNFPTRYLVNDACVILGKPNVYGSIYRFEGQASVFATPDGPCYRCLFPEPPPPGLVPSCAEGGVLGVLPGLVGTIQATETIKLILGIGDSLAGRLLLIDTLGANFRTVKLRRDPACPACGTREITRLIDYEQFCGSPHVGGEPRVSSSVPEISPTETAARLQKGDIEIVDVREPHELQIAHYPKARAIPLGQLADHIAELPRDKDLVLACRTGARSARAVQQLQAAGFTRVWNLAGGIHRWIDDVDPTQPKY